MREQGYLYKDAEDTGIFLKKFIMETHKIVKSRKNSFNEYAHHPGLTWFIA